MPASVIKGIVHQLLPFSGYFSYFITYTSLGLDLVELKIF